MFRGNSQTLYAAFFDLLEDSMVDILLVNTDYNGQIKIDKFNDQIHSLKLEKLNQNKN